jgi:hypothetical protein
MQPNEKHMRSLDRDLDLDLGSVDFEVGTNHSVAMFDPKGKVCNLTVTDRQTED